MAVYFEIDPDTKRENICLSDVFTGATMIRLPDQDLKTQFHFTRDCRYLVFDDYRVLNIETLELSSLPKPEYAGSLAFYDVSSDGRYYIFTDCNGVSGAILFRDPTVAEARVAADPGAVVVLDNGVWMAESRDDGAYSVLRWDAASGSPITAASGSGYVQALVDLGGNALAVCVEEKSEYANYFDTVYLSSPTGWKKRSIPLSTDFQTDGAHKRFITIGEEGSGLWDLQTGRLIRSLNNALTVNAPYPGMRSAGFFPGGDICWSAGISADGQREALVIQASETGKVISSIPLEAPALIAASAVLKADGARLLTRGKDGLMLWDVENPANPTAVTAMKGDFLCAGPDLLALGSNNTVFLVDWKSGAIRYSLRLPESSTVTLARFSPDGKSIATLSATADQSRLEQWDCGTGAKLAVLYEETIPGGKTLGFNWCGGKIAIVANYGGQTVCKAFPYLGGFRDAYAYAKELLGGRVFDMNRDLVGLD